LQLQQQTLDLQAQKIALDTAQLDFQKHEAEENRKLRRMELEHQKEKDQQMWAMIYAQNKPNPGAN
jgi:hypothetical protein